MPASLKPRANDDHPGFAAAAVALLARPGRRPRPPRTREGGEWRRSWSRRAKRDERHCSRCRYRSRVLGGQIEKAQIFDLRELTTLSPGMTFQSVGATWAWHATTQPDLPRHDQLWRRCRASSIRRGVRRQRLRAPAAWPRSTPSTSSASRVLKGPEAPTPAATPSVARSTSSARSPGREVQGQVGGRGRRLGHQQRQPQRRDPLLGDIAVGAASGGALRQGRLHYRANDGGRLGDRAWSRSTATLYATLTDSFWARLAVRQEDGRARDTRSWTAGCTGTLCAGRALQRPQQRRHAPPAFAGCRCRTSAPGVLTISQLGERNIVSTNTTLTPPLGRCHSDRQRAILRVDRVRRSILSAILRVSGSVPVHLGATLNLGYNQNDDGDPPTRIEPTSTTCSPPYAGAVRGQTRQPGFARGRSSACWLFGANYYKG